MIYFGFTIGPVVRTIMQARKTRELWASSFVFSFFMKNFLAELKKYGEILAPDASNLATIEKMHGAGIWPDRCFLEIADSKGAVMLKKELPTLVENALKPVNEKLGGGQLDLLKKYFHCYACCFDSEKDEFKPENSDEQKIKDTRLFRLNKMLDDLELMPKFQAQNEYNLLEKLDSNIQHFYKEGFADDDEALKIWDYRGKPEKRVRSLPEIALQEFSGKDFFKTDVETAIENGIRDFREKGGKDEEIAEETMYKNLKSVLKSDLFARHRYIAIVHADGDSIGKTIASLNNDKAGIKKFSTELMDFSMAAVEAIHKYGAMPVYAGGDDLLFIAPLQNDKKETIFGLLKSLRDNFSNRNIFKNNGATLSFGLSISYYKYPLAEAREDSRKLLKDKAKSLCIEKENKEKDALAVRLLTHSGHQFETVLWQKGDSFQKWLELFQPSAELEEAFITGLMHKTDTLALWLFDACQRDTLDAFFKAHFNEAAHSEKDKFVEKVKDLAKLIYEDYQFDRLANIPDADTKKGKKELIAAKKQLGERLHAMLRLVQFQNAPDHD